MQLYDLLVIGGGINGLGIAADASARGLSVLLAEKGDFGGGTSAASSRLIHGGLRYLQYGEFGLVRESLRERGALVRQRPHLVRPIQLLIPSYHAIGPPGWKLRAGLALYDLLARDRVFPRSDALSATEVLAREPGLNGAGLGGGFIYPDAQLEFPERLCVELMLDTLANGGEALNHTGVLALTEANGKVTGATLQDALTGEIREISARLTLNAAGPWVDAVNSLLRASPPRLIGGTWGSHLVLPKREGGPRGHLYATASKDNRPFFILPWDDRLLVGTTDVPFQGDPDELQVKHWEVEYLLSELNRLFPECDYSETDVQYTTIGVRPLAFSTDSAGAKTRRHFLVDHRRLHGVGGFASIVGGKLTTYRSLAEEAVDWCCKVLDFAGGSFRKTPERCASAPAAGPATRLERLYGPRTARIEALIQRRPELARPLAPGCPACAAEAVYAVTEERARTLDDVLSRRLMLLPAAASYRAATAELCRDEGLPLV